MDLPMHSAFEEYFRTPREFFCFANRGALAEAAAPFYFGPEIPCYGRRWQGIPTLAPDVLPDVAFEDGKCLLPFNPTEVAHNLRCERYSLPKAPHMLQNEWLREAYYFLRPLLPLRVRKHAQRVALRDARKNTFPAWPVDRTVDKMFEAVLAFALKTHDEKSVPFIWFWPEGKCACVLMTHDVETRSGLEACDALMAVDQSFDIPASFQLIPNARYHVTPQILSRIRSQGFEINVHDWKHDGSLFRDLTHFKEQAEGINARAAAWNAKGFRAGALYRNLEWMQALNVEYDMSVPNVGRMDPQPGGCCTVFPWFAGSLLEIPVTMTQDYTLFNILNNCSLDLWMQQLEIVLEGHGLASFIVHPDYIQQSRPGAVYAELLSLLADLRVKEDLWVTRPGEVNLWWRQRAQMRLLRDGERWGIVGPGRERARIAFASLRDGELAFTLPPLSEADATAASVSAVPS